MIVCQSRQIKAIMSTRISGTNCYSNKAVTLDKKRQLEDDLDKIGTIN